MILHEAYAPYSYRAPSGTASWRKKRQRQKRVRQPDQDAQPRTEVIDVSSGLVTFRWTFVFESDGVRMWVSPGSRRARSALTDT